MRCRQLGLQALSNAKGSIPLRARAAPSADGQEQSKDLRAALVRQRRGQFALHALKLGRDPPLARLATGPARSRTSTLRVAWHSQLDIAEQGAKPRPVVVLNRWCQAALGALLAISRRSLKMPSHDLVQQTRQQLLAFGQTNPERRNVFASG